MTTLIADHFKDLAESKKQILLARTIITYVYRNCRLLSSWWQSCLLKKTGGCWILLEQRLVVNNITSPAEILLKLLLVGLF